MKTVMVKVSRFALMVALLSGLVGLAGGADAKEASFVFADSLPDGVGFQTLVAATATEFRYHVPGVVLERDVLDCSQATGKLFTKEHLIFVEWGEVEVHDWTTQETVASLQAGDSFGPTQEEGQVYLIGSSGRTASVLRFGTTAAAAGDASQLPDATYEAAGCHNGQPGRAPVQPAAAITLVSLQGDRALDFALGAEYTMYMGVLTVDAGRGFFAKDGDHADVASFTSTGSAIFVPLVGGLGGATSGGVGYGQVAPGPALALFPGLTLGGLVNEGGWPLAVLVVGTVPSGQPTLQQVS